MAKLCPTCKGTVVGCPTCNMPSRIPNAQMKKYRGRKALGGITSFLSDVFLPLVTKTTATTTDWEVQGVDLSKWNGEMDLSITKTKCQYAILRYGYGTEWKDSRVDIYYNDAKSLDFPVGAYWYCNIGVDPILTAESFAEEIVSKPPQLDIVLDAETTTLNPTGTLNWLKTVDVKIRELTGKKPMIYTSGGFWNSMVARSDYWRGRRLWVANWTTASTPYMPLDWDGWLHWQWSADGNRLAHDYGMIAVGDYDIDLDRYNGTCAQFNAQYGTHIEPIGGTPVPPPPVVVPEKVIVNVSGLNIRHVPDASSTTTVCATTTYGKVLYPEAIEKDNDGREWYKLGKKMYVAKWLTRLP